MLTQFWQTTGAWSFCFCWNCCVDSLQHTKPFAHIRCTQGKSIWAGIVSLSRLPTRISNRSTSTTRYRREPVLPPHAPPKANLGSLRIRFYRNEEMDTPESILSQRRHRPRLPNPYHTIYTSTTKEHNDTKEIQKKEIQTKRNGWGISGSQHGYEDQFSIQHMHTYVQGKRGTFQWIRWHVRVFSGTWP